MLLRELCSVMDLHIENSYIFVIRYILSTVNFSLPAQWRRVYRLFILIALIRNTTAAFISNLTPLSFTSFVTSTIGSRLPNWGNPPLPSPPLPSLFFPPVPFPLASSPSLPLEVGPLNTARRSVSCKLPSEVWGGAPAEIEFRAF